MRARVWAGVVASVIAGAGLVATGPEASGQAAEPVPVVVSVGDSYISGEAGRWAGNTNGSSSTIDALGPSAYLDLGGSEAIPGCHRARSAEIHISVAISVNLACSGARTTTTVGSTFKPGLDFYLDAYGRKGQALMLQELAAISDVRMVVVSIGGNDFNFGSIVQTCVSNFLTSPSWWPNYCYDDAAVSSNFSAANVAARTAAITNALTNIRIAMANAGKAESSYTILVQTYPSPIPLAAGFRYSQSGYTRQSTGGCGFWNRDADWANRTALATINSAVRNAAAATGASNIRILELQSSMNGRRLCEHGVGLLEEKAIAAWWVPGAPDVTEWVNQVRTVSTIFGPYLAQESLHPNLWGQLAIRNCLRQAYDGGAVRGGTCVRGTGINPRGEPTMTLQ